MKNIILIISAIILCSCSQQVQEEERPTIITGVVKKIGLTSGKRQDFVVTIQDLHGALHEERVEEISYNVGDTITLESY